LNWTKFNLWRIYHVNHVWKTILIMVQISTTSLFIWMFFFYRIFMLYSYKYLNSFLYRLDIFESIHNKFYVSVKWVKGVKRSQLHNWPSLWAKSIDCLDFIETHLIFQSFFFNPFCISIITRCILTWINILFVIHFYELFILLYRLHAVQLHVFSIRLEFFTQTHHEILVFNKRLRIIKFRYHCVTNFEKFVA